MASPEAELRNLLLAEMQAGYFTAAYIESGCLDQEKPVLRIHESQGGHVFDLASLTKALVTGPLVHKVLSADQQTFEAPLRAWAPAEAQLPEQLLSLATDAVLGHVSGLPAWWNFWINHLAGKAPDRPSALQRMEEVLARIPLGTPGPDVYSDVGYILLGYLLEKRGGKSLAQLFLAICPPDLRPSLGYPAVLNLAADAYVPTAFCKIRERPLRGEVHDENCAALGGIAGHAGLFGTGEALALYLKHLFASAAGSAYLQSNEEVRLSKKREGLLGLRRGNGLSAGVFAGGEGMGHLGFTGTAFWIHLASRKYVIFLSNRVISGRVSPRITEIRRQVFQQLDKSLG